MAENLNTISHISRENLEKNYIKEPSSDAASSARVPKISATKRDNNKNRNTVFILSLINHKLTQPAAVEEEQIKCACFNYSISV